MFERALFRDVLAPHRAALDPDRTPALGPAPRRFFAAAHIVMLPEYASVEHSEPPCGRDLLPFIDWEATFALRRHLDRQGLGIAEAMDTAQRFEVGWDVARRLIEGTATLELGQGFIAGAGTDHVLRHLTPAERIEAVVYQARFIHRLGGTPILLPLVELALESRDPQAYVDHYLGVLDALEGPVLIHWLGAAFHPALRNYFPGDSFERILEEAGRKVVGCKLSLLDPKRERDLRRRLHSRGQVVFTGDDLHFAELVIEEARDPESWTRWAGLPLARGEFSHALLGVFDALAIPAGLALRALAAGRFSLVRELLEPCQAFGRHVFAPPTAHYKAALAFTSYLAGLQQAPLLPLHHERLRDRQHLVRAAELAAAAGAFEDPARACQRLEAFLAGNP